MIMKACDNNHNFQSLDVMSYTRVISFTKIAS